MPLQIQCSPNARAHYSFVSNPAGAIARLLAALLLTCVAGPAFAQVSLTTLDTPVTQNFNTLPSTGTAPWTSNVTIVGWYGVRTGTGTSIAADVGTNNGGNLYSYGSAASSDRALGSIGSSNAAAGNFFYGARLANNTGATITSLDVAYVGEQWRNGAAAAQTVAFSYLVGTPTVTGSVLEFQSAGTPVTALDFTSPITGGTAGALDGNAAANRTAKSTTISGLSIPNGTEIMLRWSDPDHTGADHGLSIDDFSVTPHGAISQPNLTINDVSVTEGNAGTATATFTVTLSAPAGAGGVTFDIGTADGTASAGSDYVASTLTSQSIAAGNTTYTFNVTVNGDIASEANETFFVNVTNVTGAAVTDGQGLGTILDDDAPHLSIDNVSHNEGNAGTTTYTFTVSLTQPAPPAGVSFDIATADGSATAPSDYTAKTLTSQTIASGNTSYSFTVLVNGDTTSEPDEAFNVNVTNVVNAALDDGQGVGTIVNDDVQKIHDVQGNGAATPMPGATVTVEGVVTANFLGAAKLSGFFLQEEDADADADPNTSEGIFVFCTSCAAGAVAEGQRVKVTGVVSEFFNMTELTPASAALVVVTDAGNHLAEVTPATITLPVVGDVDAFYEAREAMLVTYTDTLTVSEYFELPRYGQIELVQGARPRTFTEDSAPSVAGLAAHLDALNRRHVILDDDNNVQNSVLAQPNGSQAMYWPHTNGGFSRGVQGPDFFRGGDHVSGLTGVLHWSFAGLTGTDAWRIRPTDAHPVTFTPDNPRPATPPAVGGSIRAVGMNLLNYFTTIDTTSSSSSGPCGPSGGLDCRGADSVAELNRQRERASIVVCTLLPDVAGFMELENTTPSDTITDLLGAVNARCGGAHPYAFANTGGTLGTDAIRVQIVYRSGILSPVGSPLVDLDPVHNRPPTAQTFDVVDATNPAFGKRFTVIANHFKSKGSCPSAGDPDADQGDGQSCWAVTRTAQANRLMSWINSTVIPAAGDPDVLLLGDFNSYAHETPVTTLEAGGYTDLETDLHGTNAYSYQFDGEVGHLDYAFASASLATQITGADAWHINADEVPSFDYNDEIRDTGEATQEEKPDGSALVPPRVVFEPATPYRASDHDPVVVGLFGSTDLAVTIGDSPDPVTAGNNLTYTITATNNGPSSASAATLADTLPAGTTFVSLSSAAGWSCTTPAVGAGGTVNCSIATFAVGSANFTLTVAVGSGVAGGTVLSDTVTVASSTGDSNAANNSATATTTVVGAPQGHLTISPTSVPFGNVPVGTTSAAQTVTLGNDGSASLNVTTLTAANLPFARAGGTCANTTPITIAVGTSCTLTYTFTPSTTNAANQTLTVTANAPGSGTIALSGTGVQGHLTISPTSVPFGNVAIGTTSAAQTVTLGNDGTASLNVTTLTAANLPFARSGGTCANTTPITIAAGASCTLMYTFTPSTTNAANQTLTVTANAPGSGTIALSGTGVQGHLTISPTSVPFGNVTVGTTSAPQTVTLGNDGTASLDVTALTAATTPFARAGGTCANTTPITIAAGASCTLTYTFTPSTTNAANQTLTVTANAPGSGTIALAGTGTAQQADVSVTITDDRHYVQVGDSLDYVITVSNAGPGPASVNVVDVLPGELLGNAWVCTPTGGATCNNGVGTLGLNDSAVLPSGSSASYVYTAVVQSEGSGAIANSVTATVGGGVVDPTPANNTASDTPSDVVVIFADGFENGGVTLALDGYADAHGFVSARLVIDPVLVDSLGLVPVAVASGELANGRNAFTLELARFGAQTMMRLSTRDEQGMSKLGEWSAIDLRGGALDFAWQSASAGARDGYVRIAAGNTSAQSVDRAESARLVRLHTVTAHDVPWLSLTQY